ncbi:MAG: Asp-tRNA(Asn)/Glu-tRNA(Gln) amidotransferase subunit GatC [Chloroflexi bacterium]|nr:Asp-tRNA(Asn)/Glu-tRNA(Gln) amidotransferase subunit GatC [Chloroflexota bacterium]
MPLSREDVEHIALLARLHLTAEEKERYREQLSNILDHISKLQELDTSSVQPMSSVVVEQSRLREDVAGPAMPREDLLRNAPDAADGQFRVPPVLDTSP